MTDSPDNQTPKPPTPQNELGERDQRDLARMRTSESSDWPKGCIVSLIVLALVFFMILGVCYRG